MRAVLIAVVAALLQGGAGATAAAQTTTKHVISLAAADRIAGAAEAEAKKRGSTVVIVVVDDGGYPIVLRRLDDTQVASVEVGIGKARTAAIFRRSSGVFEEQVRNGRLATLVLPGSTPLQGGVPILFEGKTIGAIGVSGNTPKEDEEIALAGAAVAEAALKAEAVNCPGFHLLLLLAFPAGAGGQDLMNMPIGFRSGFTEGAATTRPGTLTLDAGASAR